MERHRRRTIHRVAPAAATACLVLIGAACGASPSPSDQPIARLASPTSSTGAVSSQEPAPSATEPTYDLGTEAVTPRGGRMTVFDVGATSRTTAPPPGTAWQGAEIQFCLSTSIQSAVPIETIRAEFALELPDGTRAAPNTTAPLPDESFLVAGRTIAPGECVRGPVVFAIPEGSYAAYVMLVSPLGNLRWRVG